MGDNSLGDDDTIVRPRAVAPRSPEGAASDDTIIRLVEPAPLRRADALPTDPPRAGSALTESARSSPVDLPASAVAWGLRVRGTTMVVPLDLPAVVGRRPGPVRPNEHPAPRRVVIPADRRDVSARHARFEQVGESLVVTDLGSTNGVVVHWSSGATRRLRSRESCAVLPDTIIGLGEGVDIEFVAVTPPSTPSPPEHP
ncbi:FHA domain-containing protein [Microcella sp.]|uniref:FHA domain-containing protein n=1 Tax=Microcella sp. TaxID=1913979 RepID=UPI00299F6C84|nr:FHA domain-containing protein [Microcella sp.]MDX2025308.1 FHA domain-containing protein [Microcella sp.]